MFPLTLLSLALLPLIHAQTFTLTSSLPGSPLDGQPVNAAGQAFYIGLSEPATYCPTTVEPNCPNVTGTVFAGMSALLVEVPGGQQVYTLPSGALGFTQAHSASVPTGSYIGDFTNITVVSDCAPTYNILSFALPNSTFAGVLACPVINSTTQYQVYSNTPAFNQTGCTKLDGLKPSYAPDDVYGAWQYI